MKKLILSLTAALSFVACDNSALIEHDIPQTAQYINILSSEKPSSTPLVLTGLGDTAYLDADVRYRFYTSYYTGNLNYLDESVNGISSVLWTIDSSFYNLQTFLHTFQSPGPKDCMLESVDYFGDTLRSHFTVLINTPNQINLESPADKDNQIDPNSTVLLQWNISGIDPWETAQCAVFASNDPETIWDTPIGVADCSKNIKLGGFGDTNQLSNTVYWAVLMAVDSPNGTTQYTQSDIFSFSTKLDNKGYSLLTIPVRYKNTISQYGINTEIILTSAEGDTLQKLSNKNGQASFDVIVAPQTGLKIIAREKALSEYKADVQIVDIPENSAILADTLLFIDRTPPQIHPDTSDSRTTSELNFFVLDKGTGINPSRFRVIVNDDTMSYAYNSPKLNFTSYCKSNCKLFIEGEDYAGNRLPDNYWKAYYMNGRMIVSGPYSKEGE